MHGRMTGLEPANDGVTTHCRNHLATPAVDYCNKIKKLFQFSAKIVYNPFCTTLKLNTFL